MPRYCSSALLGHVVDKPHEIEHIVDRLERVRSVALSDGRVALRDTEQPGIQPWVLRRAVWDKFITGAKNGLFD
jgi:hypothetical protein